MVTPSRIRFDTAVVLQDVDTPVNPNGDDPPAAQPILLPKLTADFKLCAGDDPVITDGNAGTLPKTCERAEYTDQSTVVLGLDTASAVRVRYIIDYYDEPDTN